MPQIILDLTADQATRLQDALTETLGLPGPATIDDAKNYIVANLQQIVRTSEKRQAHAAAEGSLPTDLDVT